MEHIQNVDITPAPRILRILGEIPFQPWQCIAELIDNSIDAFLEADAQDVSTEKREITVSWSRDSVAPAKRTLEVQDNAAGMTLSQIQNAVRAGYSSNDPVSKLGLFGMGFNIATARLGDITEIYSARKEDSEWVGLRIDFDALTRAGMFKAPVLHLEKSHPEEHGTLIRVSSLKSGIRDTLSNKENEIRKILQNVYSPLLNQKNISVTIRSKRLSPLKPCVWGKNRFVMYNGKPVPAVIEINQTFGSSFFDTEKNRYLTEDEADAINSSLGEGIELPGHIISREKRVTGWIGIQRYANPSDFGIDLIRNGRKIRMSDKTFFSYDDPWTNTPVLQYPVDLGTTVGGRIVGELNVDFLPPTYQKNDFDRTDHSWRQLTDYICGSGPYLPKARKAAGFTDPVEAPIPLLANAYRRCDPGTKCLYVPPTITKQLLAEFRKGNPAYQSDDLWFKAAQEADQKKIDPTPPVNPGPEPTDDPIPYLPDNPSPTPPQPQPINPTPIPFPVQPAPAIPLKEDLLGRSQLEITLCGEYSFGTISPLTVRAYKLSTGEITIKGVSKACFFDSAGIDCTFVYNPRHVAFTQYPITPKGLLLQYLAEKIKARDAMLHTDIVDVYVQLTQNMMSESRIDKTALQEKANLFFKNLRDKLEDALSGQKLEELECISEASGEVEETIMALFPNTDIIVAFQKKAIEGYPAIEAVPYKTLVRLVDRFPSYVFDGKVLNTPYESICLPTTVATERMRDEAKDRMLSFLKDALRMINATTAMNKNELSRAAISIEFLEEALV